MAGVSCRSRPRPWRPSRSGPGRETSGNWRTPWRAVIAARGRTILPEHIDSEEPLDPAIPTAGDAAAAEGLPLRALLAEVERRAIQRALQACAGNRTKTAERLGISRRQLFDKIREYDLQP
jgi:two-component system response regulator AtoC